MTGRGIATWAMVLREPLNSMKSERRGNDLLTGLDRGPRLEEKLLTITANNFPVIQAGYSFVGIFPTSPPQEQPRGKSGFNTGCPVIRGEII